MVGPKKDKTNPKKWREHAANKAHSHHAPQSMKHGTCIIHGESHEQPLLKKVYNTENVCFWPSFGQSLFNSIKPIYKAEIFCHSSR